MFKKALINTIIIFILSFLIHTLYHSLPIFITSIIAPVNESIFEHLKMIFSAYMLYLLIQMLFLKKKQPNLTISLVITALLNILVFLIIYLPTTAILKKEILVITLIIYFISIFISSFLLLKIQSKKHSKKNQTIAIIAIIIIYIVFTILTYYPLKTNIFLDTTTNSYGIFSLD